MRRKSRKNSRRGRRKKRSLREQVNSGQIVDDLRDMGFNIESQTESEIEFGTYSDLQGVVDLAQQSVIVYLAPTAVEGTLSKKVFFDSDLNFRRELEIVLNTLLSSVDDLAFMIEELDIRL